MRNEIMSKVLIVEDEEAIADIEKDYLELSGFEVTICKDGTSGLAEALDGEYDICILDVMLPGIDGYEVLREIRRGGSLPVIMLSAKGETFDRVLGLELGADDYIMKPFDSKEMVARVKAVLRRSTKATVGESTPTPTPQVPQQELEIVTFPDLQINLSDYSVHYKDQMIEMPPKELELFYFLASHPNQVFTREQLLDHIWSYDYIGDTRTVDVHIKRLREKFKDHDQWKLATVWGIGYKFEFHEKGNA